MSEESAVLYGECIPWPTKEALVGLLKEAGLRVIEGQYSVRVADCSHFVFQHLGGDLSVPRIDADADNAAPLTKDATLVSLALAAAGVKHRFEVYDHDGHIFSYLHYDWPANG